MFTQHRIKDGIPTHRDYKYSLASAVRLQPEHHLLLVCGPLPMIINPIHQPSRNHPFRPEPRFIGWRITPGSSAATVRSRVARWKTTVIIIFNGGSGAAALHIQQMHLPPRPQTHPRKQSTSAFSPNMARSVMRQIPQWSMRLAYAFNPKTGHWCIKQKPTAVLGVPSLSAKVSSVHKLILGG